MYWWGHSSLEPDMHGFRTGDGSWLLFLSKEHAQPACKRLCSRPSESEWDFDTLQELFPEGNDNTAVNLMHGITHVHQVDTKVLYQPERVEEQM